MDSFYSIKDMVYGGRFHDYLWNPSYNPLATIENCLADCTAQTIGFSYILKKPYPVSVVKSASVWDKYLINGYVSKPYGSVDLKIGDIIQWKTNCHVATVVGFLNGKAILGCSWYTGQNGKSTIVVNGKTEYDPRTKFGSTKEVSDFMEQNYPYRMYHETTVDDESNRVGGKPDNVFVCPETVTPVEKNSNVTQIQVLTDEQNVRDKNMNVIGIATSGYYNVLSSMAQNGYRWFEVEKGKYIAYVSGRVLYYPAKDNAALEQKVEKLTKENDKLKKQLDEIRRLTEYE